MERLGDVHHSDIEIRSVNDRNGAFLNFWIVSAIILFYMEINGLRSQFGVQLAWFSIQSRILATASESI